MTIKSLPLFTMAIYSHMLTTLNNKGYSSGDGGNPVLHNFFYEDFDLKGTFTSAPNLQKFQSVNLCYLGLS